MIDLLILGRTHGYEALREAIEKTLAIGCTDVSAVVLLRSASTFVPQALDKPTVWTVSYGFMATRDSQRTVAVILEAAERVIVQSGVEKTTIDEVAREAGVSKGGVLHHFPSKEAIVLGLAGKLIEKFEADVAARQAADPELRGSLTRAFLNTVCESDDHCIEVCLALKSAFRDIPALQELVRNAHLRWQARIEDDGIDPVHASVVYLASEGLWMARVHRIAVPSRRYRAALIDYLMGLTRMPAAKKQRQPARPRQRARQLTTR